MEYIFSLKRNVLHSLYLDHNVEVPALSIFITRDVITHCYSSRNKSVYPMFNT